MQTFRYSAINTAAQCQTKYKLQYLDRLEVPGKPSIDLEFGTVMHAAVNACLMGEDPLVVFRMYWGSFNTTDFVKARNDWDYLNAVGETFLERFVRLHKKHFTPVRMETMLEGTIGKHRIQGTPDFVGLYKGVPSIVDFKTSGYEYAKEKIVVNEQQPIYAELEKQVHGYSVQQLVYMVFVKNEGRIQVVTRPLTKQLLDNAISNAILICDELEGRTKFTRNTNSCLMGKFKCPYFDTCHGGS